jgi:YD repeat-containing protein
MNIMKIRKSIAVAVCVLLSSCAKRTDWNMFGLRGEVKSYKETHYQPEKKGDTWQKGAKMEYGHSKVTFEKTGKYTSMEFIFNDNTLLEKMVPERKGESIVEYRYDSEGKVIGRSEIENISEEEFAFISYDEKGKKISEGSTFFKNHAVVKQELEIFNPSGEVRDKVIVTFKYDDDGNLVSHKQTNGNGDVPYHYRYKYLEFDKYNNWIKRLDYSHEGKGNIPERMAVRSYEYY